MIKVFTKHYNERPCNVVVDTVVLHYTDTWSVEETFLALDQRRVSCHYFICEFGRIFSFVDLKKRAWHAGESEFLGRPNVNDFSIGIELQNPGEKFFEKYGIWRNYTDVQMNVLIELLQTLNLDYVTGHHFIAPLRKKDPGPHFNWDILKKFNVGRVLH